MPYNTPNIIYLPGQQKDMFHPFSHPLEKGGTYVLMKNS